MLPYWSPNVVKTFVLKNIFQIIGDVFHKKKENVNTEEYSFLIYIFSFWGKFHTKHTLTKSREKGIIHIIIAHIQNWF
jgi:hypothetical protein